MSNGNGIIVDMKKFILDVTVGTMVGLVVAITPYVSERIGEISVPFYNFFSESPLNANIFVSQFFFILVFSSPFIFFYALMLSIRNRLGDKKVGDAIKHFISTLLIGTVVSYGLWVLMILKAVSNWTLF